MPRGMKFIGEEIEVHFEEKPGPPHSFVWRGKVYRIEEVLAAKRVLDFRRAWWARRYRDFYTVRVHTGQVFELYFHRGPGRRYWVLLGELLREQGEAEDSLGAR